MNLIQEKLVEDNLAIVGRVVRRVKRGCPPCIDTSDLESAGNLALVKAAIGGHDARDFPAFAATRIRGAVLDERRRLMIRDRGRVQMPVDVDIQPPIGINLDLFAAMSALPPREYRAIVLMYWAGSSQAEVAEILGVSQQTVSRILNSAKKSLRECVGRQTQTTIHVRKEERPVAA